MLALYLLTLFFSSGMTGVYIRHVVAEQGFITGFSGGAMLTMGIACAYASTQLCYVAFLRLLWPPKTNLPLFPECLSHMACLLLVPYLMGIDIPWPYPILTEVEPLIFLAAFAAAHIALKAFTLFSFLRSLPGNRFPAAIWAAAAATALLAGYLCSASWLGRVERAQHTGPEEAKPYRIGGAYAMARALREGADLTVPLTPGSDTVLTFRLANLPDAPEENRVDRIHTTIDFESESGKSYEAWIDVDRSRWLEMRLPADIVPDDATACTVMWGLEEPPKWRALTKLRPAVQSERSVLVSGPVLNVAQTAKATPSVVVIAIDGLGAYHVTGLGTRTAFTPSLGKFAKGSVSFLQAYTTSPESPAASMSLMTGVGPLRHGHLGKRLGPTPPSIKTVAETLHEAGYATAAFTEGDRSNDLVFENSIARGFDIFDPSALFEESTSPDSSVIVAPATVDADASTKPAELPAFGSTETLNLAAAWIAANHGSQYFAFLRLTELRDPSARAHYGISGAAADPQAIYEAALTYVDRALGKFLSSVRDSARGANTYIIVTGTYGTDFAGGASATEPGLTEPALRIPLVLFGPGLKPAERKDLVSIEDVAPTIAALCKVALGSSVAPKSLLGDSIIEEPASVAGDPLVITARNNSWRIYWETARTPFVKDTSGPRGTARLYDLRRYVPGAGLADMAPRQADLTAQWIAVLQRYLEVQSGEW
ncbi:MAG: sulfatase-like hydrolase/transferase [Candidatus Hydrogenedentales bacterium]